LTPSEPTTLPVLVVGDVHGDLERLFQALKPYPADKWHTIFLGDLVDGGIFGVGALRYARDRPNSTVLIGNHEALMLAALNDPDQMLRWLGVGGQQHDLDELRNDGPLQEWIRTRPALLRLPDGTLVQHADNDGYRALLPPPQDQPDPVATINENSEWVLRKRPEFYWDVTSPYRVFDNQPARLRQWLELTGSRRVVHGHSPHSESRPKQYHEGRAVNFDGGLGRFGGPRYRKRTPAAASVAPLPP
jgi:Calcineurin-like phosphoesterase